MPELLPVNDGWSQPLRDVEVEGLVYINFEQHDFRPLGQVDVWWISGGVDLFHALSNLNADIPPKKRRMSTYARVLADISAEGSFGHRGIYCREIVAKDVAEIRLATDQERLRWKEEF